MSALIKFAGARLVHQIDTKMLAANVTHQITLSGMCLELRGAQTYAATGENKDKLAEEVVGNQRVYMPLGILRPIRYQALVAVNPALYAMGDVNAPSIGEPGEDMPLVIRMRAYGPCKPSELPWLVRIYLLD